ncbi:MAG: exonuclease [Podoviridae sp. ctbj_2]|nr:MAG: exonuclease [Podoviridae sp. ctbj_2]
MRAAIDADILQYEIAFAAESRLKHWLAEGKEMPEDGHPPLPWVHEMIEERVNAILRDSGAVGEPIMFFTGKNNFRFDVAFTQPYKVRDDVKPYHHANVKTFIEYKYECHEVEGLEADDLIGIIMTANPGKFICCSRDKDLRQLAGWHFGWELHKQPQFGPMEIDEFGFLELRVKNDKAKTKYLVGGGDLFFFSQLLTGDRVDCIPGCNGVGPVAAFKILEGAETSADCFERVWNFYKQTFGLYAPDIFLEQGRLLRMVRKLDGERKPILWNPSLFERS